VYRAIQESAAEYTRNVNALMAEFVERTNCLRKEQYELPGTGTVAADGRVGQRPARQRSGVLQRAYPIQGGRDGLGR
jgi:hypothetical protein